ncbi:MAG TPA: hypothetical protein VFG69_12070, partial [Nannocystaceae bacterium]|nr:hypothetical protein [Nannocystaceae bacterium]
MPALPRRSLLWIPLVAATMGGCAFFSTAFDKSAEPPGGRRYTGTECEGLELEEHTDFTRDDAGNEKRSVRLFSQQPARVDALPMRVAKVACGD